MHEGGEGEGGKRSRGMKQTKQTMLSSKRSICRHVKILSQTKTQRGIDPQIELWPVGGGRTVQGRARGWQPQRVPRPAISRARRRHSRICRHQLLAGRALTYRI